MDHLVCVGNKIIYLHFVVVAIEEGWNLIHRKDFDIVFDRDMGICLRSNTPLNFDEVNFRIVSELGDRDYAISRLTIGPREDFMTDGKFDPQKVIDRCWDEID